MGIVRMGPPQEMVLALKQALAAHIFVETGTYRGVTTRWACDYFDRVVSLEGAEAFYETARQTLSDLNNVELVFGHSGECLPDVLTKLNGTMVFWLDAHWSGGETYGESDECPILNELAAINQRGMNDAILIDDARLFTAPPPAPHRAEQWPGIAQIIEALRAPSERYVVIWDDVIVAVPQHHRSTLQTFCRQAHVKPAPIDEVREGLRTTAKGLRHWVQKLRKAIPKARRSSRTDRFDG